VRWFVTSWWCLIPVLVDGVIIYLARTSFQAAGRSTACGSRSLVATVCFQCRALTISSAGDPVCRLPCSRWLYISRFPPLIAASPVQTARDFRFSISIRFSTRRRSCSGVLPSSWWPRTSATGLTSGCAGGAEVVAGGSVVAGRRHVHSRRQATGRAAVVGRTDGRTDVASYFLFRLPDGGSDYRAPRHAPVFIRAGRAACRPVVDFR